MIGFENGVLIYNGIPLNLYGVIGLFKMVNYTYNPSVWASGLEETMVDYIMEYTINLKFGENEYPFKSSDLFIIRDWLRDNDDDWYDSLPNIDPKVKEVL